jgi:hypothetical protein
MIREYEITDEPLLRLAKIVNTADTRRLDNAPLAAGFEPLPLAMGLGFHDGKENLRKQFDVCDALYARYGLEVAKEL